MKKGVTALFVVTLLSCGQSQPAATARLLDSEGEVVLELRVSLAETEYELQEGLRLHGTLAGDEALALLFPQETEVCIGNSGVPFPIDVLYVSASSEIVASQSNIPPNAPGPYCQARTKIALELNGGSLPSYTQLKLELF